MKSKAFLGASFAMLMIAICFVIYALNNPQASFPWGNSTTYTVFAFYSVIMIVFFVMFLRRKKA